MIIQIVGTNRPGSMTEKVAAHVADLYEAAGGPLDVLDLHQLPAEIFLPTSYSEKPASFARFSDRVLAATGAVIVMPEYNGGFPGIFKYFYDMLPPDCLKNVPVVFVGLAAGMWGALRPVEQMSALLAYRGSLLYPHHVQISGVQHHLDEQGRIKTAELIARIEQQAAGFVKFVAKLAPNPASKLG